MFRNNPVPVLTILLGALMLLQAISAFSPSFSLSNESSTGKVANNIFCGEISQRKISSSTTSLSMGMFDAFSKAFQNTEYGPPAEQVRATARHILVPSKEEAQIVMKMVASGEQSFEECAQQFSTCPSSSKGGSLGSFSPGTMVKEFDEVIFNPDTQIGQVVGPVLTQFGHHVIVVEKRTGGGDWY